MISSFMTLAATPGVYYAFENSDMVGKSIVVLLLVISTFTWSVMIEKGISLYRAKKLSSLFIERFKANTKSITNAQMLREAVNNASPAAQIYNQGVEKLLEFYESDSATFGRTTGVANCPTRLSEAQYNAIEAVLISEESWQEVELETRVGFLATMVSVSPFLGLFGTVWGVMLAFCGIAAAGKSDFSALAPGVAGALLTTVAGLIVAIPSLIGYNLLTSTIRNITTQLDNFSDEFMARIKLEQLGIAKELSRENSSKIAPES
ncbi:MAG: MotA/TolQ/ExbB proton channel family protein [Victivallales bacterium]|jgi:biopolymer transport protein ExbB/TolQ|nr:MotA/TolQ/ExbB proton channel family protein [Victivallales bacterium]